MTPCAEVYTLAETIATVGGVDVVWMRFDDGGGLAVGIEDAAVPLARNFVVDPHRADEDQAADAGIEHGLHDGPRLLFQRPGQVGAGVLCSWLWTPVVIERSSLSANVAAQFQRIATFEIGFTRIRAKRLSHSGGCGDSVGAGATRFAARTSNDFQVALATATTVVELVRCAHET